MTGPQGSLGQGTQEESWLLHSYPGPESEDSDKRIVLSTHPSQRVPATGSSPTPELGDTTHNFSPTHEPRNVDNSPLLSLPSFILLSPPLMHPLLRLLLLMAPMPRAKFQVQQWITNQCNSVLALPHFLPLYIYILCTGTVASMCKSLQ